MARRALVAGIVLVSVGSVRGDGPASGLVVQPVVETQAATVSVGNGAVYAGSVVGPTLRLGYQLPKARLTADLRYGALVAVQDGDVVGQHAFTIGAGVAPTVWSSKRGCMRINVLGNFNLGTLIDQGPLDNRDAYLTGGFLLGAGIDLFGKRRAGLGVELGVQTQFTRFPGELATTVGVHVGLSGLFYPKLDGAKDPVDDCHGEAPPPTLVLETPKGATVTCDETHPCDPLPTCTGYDDPTHCTPPIPPITYGEELDGGCRTTLEDGWFEPTQGVYQDDAKFGDKVAGLYRAPTGIVYFGTLNMVKGRHTVFTGVNWYIQNRARHDINSRASIVMKGKSTCRESVPVKMQFTLFERGVPRVVYTSSFVGSLPLRGGARPETAWSTNDSALYGAPREPETFQINATGPFWIEAELIEFDGKRTGFKMVYYGQTQEVKAPTLTFYPVVMTPDGSPGKSRTMQLVALAAGMVGNSILKIADWFPLTPRSVQARLGETLDFVEPDLPWYEDLWEGAKDLFSSATTRQKAAAKLTDRLQTSTAFTNGGRALAVIQDAEFEAAYGKDAAAFTPSTKVIFIRSSEDVGTVAHEFVHTTPQHLWSSDQMIAECGQTYHNEDANWAAGLRVTRDGSPQTSRLYWDRGNEAPQIMGPSLSEQYKWITQCTYVHLMRTLNALVDPPMLLVRAVLAKKPDGSGVVGVLGPVYDLMADEELRAGAGGEHAFVLKDAQGKVLGRFPFAFSWSVGDGPDWTVKAIAHRVPALPGVATIELVVKDKILSAKTRSASAPVVAFRGVKEGAVVRPVKGAVQVGWTTQVASGRPAIATLLYSSDGGKTWATVLFETKQDHHDLVLPRGSKDHRVRLLVSDGTRSSEQTLRFATR